jgi:hypothetical protein
MEILRNNFYKIGRLRRFFIINKKIKRDSSGVFALLCFLLLPFYFITKRQEEGRGGFPKGKIERGRDNPRIKTYFYLFSLFCLFYSIKKIKYLIVL